MRVGFEALTSLLPCLAFANFPRICEIIDGPSREQRVRGWGAEFAPESGFVLKPRFYDLFAIQSAPFRAVARPDLCYAWPSATMPAMATPTRLVGGREDSFELWDSPLLLPIPMAHSRAINQCSMFKLVPPCVHRGAGTGRSPKERGGSHLGVNKRRHGCAFGDPCAGLSASFRSRGDLELRVHRRICG